MSAPFVPGVPQDSCDNGPLDLPSSGDAPRELRHLASDVVMWTGRGYPELIDLPMAPHSAAVLRLAPPADG